MLERHRVRKSPSHKYTPGRQVGTSIDENQGEEAMTARARWTDPATSWEAAKSVSNIRESQWRIWKLLVHLGPMHDEAILRTYERSWGKISPSGCRSRRAELVDLGLVNPTYNYFILPSGRKSVVWRAVPLDAWKRQTTQQAMLL